jgi:hypothetical protein
LLLTIDLLFLLTFQFWQVYTISVDKNFQQASFQKLLHPHPATLQLISPAHHLPEAASSCTLSPRLSSPPFIAARGDNFASSSSAI